MFSALRSVVDSFVDLLYPPLCLHCNASMHNGKSVFCLYCMQQLTLIDHRERCVYCFSADIDLMRDKCCKKCRASPSEIDKMGAVFDYEGVSASLIKHFKYGGQSYLAKGIGAFLTAQFLELDWPLPDCIIPMPMAPLRRIERGYNQSQLLAEVMADLLGCPMYDVLRRHGGGFSQAGLNHPQRLQLNEDLFYMQNGVTLYDKTVLLVDDVMTTGSSLRCCAKSLRARCPKEIYALTVCRAL